MLTCAALDTCSHRAARTLLLRWLADGHDGAQDALLPLYSSPDGTWYCRTAPDSLAAVYPIRLKHFPDPTMLSALLQVLVKLAYAWTTFFNL